MKHQYEHWSGKDYGSNAVLQQSWAKKFFFDRYKFQKNEVILDIGCGDGKITSQLAERVPHGHVIAIDQSPTMIFQAQENYRHHKNLSFFCVKAQEESFYQKYKKKFDVVTSFTALHWVKEQDQVLKGVFQVLKPDSKLYFRLSSDGRDPVYEIANELLFHKKYKSDFKNFSDPINRFSVKDYSNILNCCGFDIVSIKNVEDKDVIESEGFFKKQIKSHLPHYHFLRDNISNKKSEDFIEDIIYFYKKRIPLVNSNIVLIDHFLEVIAKKMK